MDFPEAHYIIEKLNEEFDEVQNENVKLYKKLQDQQNRMKQFMKDSLMDFIKNFQETFCDQGYATKSEDYMEWDEIIEEMNNNDWNEDNHYCELYRTSDGDILTRCKECQNCSTSGCDEDLILRAGDFLNYFCKECYEGIEEASESESSDDSSDDSSDED